MKNKSKNRRLKKTLRTTQKFRMSYIVAGSSLLSLGIGAFIYMNISNSEISKANGKGESYKVTYRTTDIDVPVRMLRNAASIEQMEESEYKTNPLSIRELPSRATDITERIVEPTSVNN